MKAFKNTEIPLNLKVPDSKKTKDWYVDYMEYCVPYKDSYVDDYNLYLLLNYIPGVELFDAIRDIGLLNL